MKDNKKEVKTVTTYSIEAKEVEDLLISCMQIDPTSKGIETKQILDDFGDLETYKIIVTEVQEIPNE